MDETAGSLLPDEEIALYTRPHAMALLPTVAATLCGMVFLFTLLVKGSVGGEVALVIKAGMVVLLGVNLCQYWIFQNTAILVTNRRVMLQKNLIVETVTSEFLLPKTQTIEVRQPLLGGLLGYGTVTVTGTGGAAEVFPYVTNPMAMRAALQQQVDAAGAPPAPAAASTDRHMGPAPSV